MWAVGSDVSLLRDCWKLLRKPQLRALLFSRSLFVRSFVSDDCSSRVIFTTHGVTKFQRHDCCCCSKHGQGAFSTIHSLGESRSVIQRCALRWFIVIDRKDYVFLKYTKGSSVALHGFRRFIALSIFYDISIVKAYLFNHKDARCTCMYIVKSAYNHG